MSRLEKLGRILLKEITNQNEKKQRERNEKEQRYEQSEQYLEELYERKFKL